MSEKKTKILIGEDEVALSGALKIKFESEGFEVEVANDGKIINSVLDKGGIDVLLLDLVMPNLGGFGVLDHIKEKDIKVKVFVTTNLSQEEDREKINSYDVKGFFVKADSTLNEIVENVKRGI